MPTIGILGANGQVGSEVCLFLSQMSGVRVIPICRTELSSAFLRQCGLECRHGTFDSPEATRNLLADCDLVIDCSLPKGRPSEIRASMTRLITNGIRFAPSNARFVYISTVMAFGVGGRDKFWRDHHVSRTIYGATKRYAERLCFRLGRRVGREVYILRLGQVHGQLQAASWGLLHGIRNEVTYVPAGPSWTVFAFTIAEALLNIALGKERPGLYTLVSSPQWSWKELHEFYCRRLGVRPQIVEEECEDTARIWLGRVRSLWTRLILNPLLATLARNREIIAGNLLSVFPKLERRTAALYSRRSAAAQIAEARSQREYRPYEQALRGNVPGQRLRSLSDSRTSMDHLTSRVRAILSTVGGTDEL